VATWNLGAERIKGYTADEIIGKPCATFLTEEDRAAGRPARLMQRAREQGCVEDEGWRLRKDGARCWANAVLTALVDANGTLRGFAKVTRDLTERRKLEEQRCLIQALQATAESRDQALSEVRAERQRLQALLSETQAAPGEAERAQQQLQRFMGLVAHDLRGPLTAITAAAQLLTRRELSPDRHGRAATLVNTQVRRMLHMTESLVEAARIGAGELTIWPAPWIWSRWFGTSWRPDRPPPLCTTSTSTPRNLLKAKGTPAAWSKCSTTSLAVRTKTRHPRLAYTRRRPRHQDA
jgi:PAS domain S-box-containing protein